MANLISRISTHLILRAFLCNLMFLLCCNHADASSVEPYRNCYYIEPGSWAIWDTSTHTFHLQVLYRVTYDISKTRTLKLRAQWVESDAPAIGDAPPALLIDETYITDFDAGDYILIIGPNGLSRQPSQAGEFVNTALINLLEMDGNQEWYVRIDIDDDGKTAVYGSNSRSDIILTQSSSGTTPSPSASSTNSKSGGGGAGCFVSSIMP